MRQRRRHDRRRVRKKADNAQQRLWCSQRRSTYLTMNAALSQQLRAAQEEVDNADFTAFDDMIGELQRLEDELKKPDPQI